MSVGSRTYPHLYQDSVSLMTVSAKLMAVPGVETASVVMASATNVENLADIRQTKYDPLIRPFPLPDVRWTVEAWAPLDGRVLNAGIRVSF